MSCPYLYFLLLGQSKLLACEKWNIACHISKQRTLQSSEIAATTDGELVTPEGTQEGKEYLPSSSHQTAATLHGEP